MNVAKFESDAFSQIWRVDKKNSTGGSLPCCRAAKDWCIPLTKMMLCALSICWCKSNGKQCGTGGSLKLVFLQTKILYPINFSKTLTKQWVALTKIALLVFWLKIKIMIPLWSTIFLKPMGKHLKPQC